MRKNICFFKRKIMKLKFTSSSTRKLYTKFDKSISPAGKIKLDELMKAMKNTPNLDEKNFHETLEKEGKKIFPLLEPKEFDVVKFIALNKYLEKSKENLAKIGDDSQLANIDLQNALQKQQQTIQVLSNVSKMMHDTSMAVIRKIG